VVIEDDCGTSNGTVMKALVEGGEVIEACATVSWAVWLVRHRQS
jgi:hypothetical protein